jgi:hypothetical protein
MNNWLKLGTGITVAYILWQTTPLLDLLMLLLYLLIPVAFVVSITMALGGAVGLISGDTNVGDRMSFWVHERQNAYARWREDLEERVQDSLVTPTAPAAATEEPPTAV